MEKVNDIIKLFEVFVLTAYIKFEKPVSALLIANAESGKSEIIKILKGYSKTIFINDLSFKPLTETLFPMIERGDVKHILIPDFINVSQHKKSAQNVIPILNSLMEEGVTQLSYYGSEKKFKEPINCGLITGITKRYFDRQIIFWRQVGFLTRMITVTFNYSASSIIEINNSIRMEKQREKHEVKLKKIKNPVNITIPQDISIQIQQMSETLCLANSSYLSLHEDSSRGKRINLKTYGFRFHKILRTLVKAICLYEDEGKRKEVNQKDVSILIQLLRFVNFNFTEV